MSIVTKKLKIYKELSGKSNEQIAKELGVTTLSVLNWLNKGSIPRPKMIQKINKLLEENEVIGDSVEKIKLNTLDTLKSKNSNILELFSKRKDLVDEFSLILTYNSNAIEGSTMTLDDTYNVLFEEKIVVRKTFKEQLESKNHHKVFLYLLDLIKDGKEINIDSIKDIHKQLMSGILDNAGQFRNHSVRIVGSFVPTANCLKIEQLLTDLLKMKPEEKNTEGIIKYVSKFHAEFEKIHPFSDGNGRVGRLLMVTQLLLNDFVPVLIKNKLKPKYYKVLQEAQLKENYLPLEDFIIDALIYSYSFL